MPTEDANIARHLTSMARQQPATPALKVPRGRTISGDIDYLSLSFAELESEVEAWRVELGRRGVVAGDRVLVMVRQGLPLIAVAFALFRMRAVPVVIDPGMGRKNFLSCVARSRPRVLVGIPLARAFSYLFRGAFRSVAVRVPVGGSSIGRCRAPVGALASDPGPSAPDELAAILFTSGSTGAPKGVRYTHGMFAAQVRLIRDAYAIAPGEIDLPMLPIFALFNPALGMTTVVPEIDPSRPAAVDPAKIVQAIRQEKVTNSFGSPTLWRKIADHCAAQKITLPTMKRVLCAGAPVPPELWSTLAPILPGGRLHSPYGATEVLPVSTIAGDHALGGARDATLRGAGTCVGRVLPANTVKIIALTDAPIVSLADVRECAPGEIGEIIVTGPTVTRDYDALPDATAAAKIPDHAPGKNSSTPPPPPHADASPSATTPAHPVGIWTLGRGISGEAAEASPVWHRMGDCGYLDAAGLLWFCGRKAERVETSDGVLFTENAEPIFNTHPGVKRSALIGLGPRGEQRPAIVVELRQPDLAKSSDNCRRLARELRALAQAHPALAHIKLFYFHPAFPVDVRHNAKIHRLVLARWAATARGYESDPKR